MAAGFDENCLDLIQKLQESLEVLPFERHLSVLSEISGIIKLADSGRRQQAKREELERFKHLNAFT
jgi:hypothetical protein